MEAVLIAPCGMNCGLCLGYLAMKYSVRSIKGKRMPMCRGCLLRGRGCSVTKSGGCELLMYMRVRFCFECKEFPCAHIKRLDENYRKKLHISPVDNLSYIKENGISKFLEKEEERWKCPECGVIICNNGICFNCGLENLNINQEKVSLD